MMPLALGVLLEALKITGFVFAMMVIVDLLNVSTKGRFKPGMQGGVWRQYLIASFLGATPGCLGAFVNVSLYVHGGKHCRPPISSRKLRSPVRELQPP